jgi:hypothetical protein
MTSDKLMVLHFISDFAERHQNNKWRDKSYIVYREVYKAGITSVLLSLGAKPETLELEDGLTCRVVSGGTANGGGIEWISPHLAPEFSKAKIVHVHDPHTSAGEAAFVIAKNLGLITVISFSNQLVESNGWLWGMGGVADAFVCDSDAQMRDLERLADKPVVLLSSDPSKSVERLVQMYNELTKESEEQVACASS